MIDRPIEDVFRDHSDRLMQIDGVVSIGIGQCGDIPCIRVGVVALTHTIREQIPESLDGHPVEVREIGPVRPREKR